MTIRFKPRVNFDIVLYWRYCYQGSVIWINNVPQVLLQVGSENGGFSIVRADFITGGYFFSEGASNGNFMGHYEARTFDTSGRFRITRTGSEVTTYYWDNGWQELLNYQNFVLDDVSFNLTAYTGDNQEAVFHAGFDRVDIIGTPTSSDSDGDGIPDDQDVCPNEDATGFDVNSDGCIDSTRGLETILDTLVQDGVIEEELQNSLISKVENANKSAEKDNICAAINQLEAFKNQVNAQRGNKISDGEADNIIEYADSVIAWLLDQLLPGDTC